MCQHMAVFSSQDAGSSLLKETEFFSLDFEKEAGDRRYLEVCRQNFAADQRICLVGLC